ncbi:MAG: pyridoxal-phosphate dependent enzyme, partial [Nitrososphaerales archaeon]
IGESSALALYAVLQMVNFGMEGKFVVVLADGAKKYKRVFESVLDQEDQEEGLEVTLESANARPGRFDGVVWTHTGYVPSEEGLKLIASSLGRPPGSVKVAAPKDVVMVVTGRDLPPGLTAVLEGSSSPGGGAKRFLLVCMSGNTSLRAAQALKSKGIKSQSLTGGITKLAQVSHKPLPSLVKPAK